MYVCIIVYNCRTQHSTEQFSLEALGQHTSAKARLTSAVISMCSRFMSVNHFPYLPIVTKPENNGDGDLDDNQNLIICSLVIAKLP